MIKVPQKSTASCLVKPLFVVVLLGGIFAIVWLRSSILTMEYSIGELECKKMERLREAKMLLAERAMLLSMQKMEKTAVRSLGLVFPDRTRVVYVRGAGQGPLKASFEKSRYGFGDHSATEGGVSPDKER
ncbi:MAG TPA: hypothetical protein VEI46_03385 [Thermodesulfovibrionales bacterium]|nr:hypothetical protein [Thermodesulfovibrionales bacterium]